MHVSEYDPVSQGYLRGLFKQLQPGDTISSGRTTWVLQRPSRMGNSAVFESTDTPPITKLGPQLAETLQEIAARFTVKNSGPLAKIDKHGNVRILHHRHPPNDGARLSIIERTRRALEKGRSLLQAQREHLERQQRGKEKELREVEQALAALPTASETEAPDA